MIQMNVGGFLVTLRYFEDGAYRTMRVVDQESTDMLSACTLAIKHHGEAFTVYGVRCLRPNDWTADGKFEPRARIVD